jgi:hypothetical protein
VALVSRMVYPEIKPLFLLAFLHSNTSYLAEKLVFELEFVLRGQRLAAPEAKPGLKKGGGALIVGRAKVERATGLTLRW